MFDRALSSRRALTMLELIIVIAIISILASVTYITTRQVRLLGSRMTTSSALRHMAAGYTAYTADYAGALMPGFVDHHTNDALGLTGRTTDGRTVATCDTTGNICDTSSYVWRLAPYLDRVEDTVLADYRERSVHRRIDDELTRSNPVFGPATRLHSDDLGLASVPSIGMNSIFLGGDTTHGNAATRTLHPLQARTTNTHVATRLAHVLNPSMCVVFAPSVQSVYANAATVPARGGAPGVALGSPELRAPYTLMNDASGTWYGAQWVTDDDAELGVRVAAIDDSFDAGGGVPACRQGDLLPVAHVDGSVAVTSLAALEIDMRRWSPRAAGLHPPALRKDRVDER